MAYHATHECRATNLRDRKSTRLNSSHLVISYAVFCLKKTANGGNRPTWRFLVLKARTIKDRVHAFSKRAFDAVEAPRHRRRAPTPGLSPGRYLRLRDA